MGTKNEHDISRPRASENYGEQDTRRPSEYTIAEDSLSHTDIASQ
jgi:hypothetical protein